MLDFPNSPQPGSQPAKLRDFRYCLEAVTLLNGTNRDSRVGLSNASKRDVSVDGARHYDGQLVFSGPDAAIEVHGTDIRGFVNGILSAPGGKLDCMIDDYRESILDGTEKLRAVDTEKVILAGKWHHVDVEREPRFEAYLVHLVTTDGRVVSHRYESEIFDWDYPGEGGGFECVLSGPAEGDIKDLRYHAEIIVDLDKCMTSPFGRPILAGVIWFACGDTNAPVFVPVKGFKLFDAERAFEERTGASGVATDPRVERFSHGAARFVQAASGVGKDSEPTIEICQSFTELRAAAAGVDGGDEELQLILSKTAFGAFRGVVVNRHTHQPLLMTVDEAMRSTVAAGYWFQTRDSRDRLTSIYTVADEPIPRGDTILRRVDETSRDDDTLGNAYASEWTSVSASRSVQWRVLAVGPVPQFDEDGI